MNRKLVEHLFKYQFSLERRIEELKDISFDSSDKCAPKLNELEIAANGAWKNFIDEALDILFDENI